MKRYYVLVGALALVVCLYLGFGPHFGQQLPYSHRILFRNEGGSVIAIAQIALPEATFFQTESFTGKWMLESWADEFPKEGTSAEDYRATRKGDNLRINLNPIWADNNVVLRGKRVGLIYKGEWLHQMRGPGAIGDFEILPISDSGVRPASNSSKSESSVLPHAAQPIIPPDLSRQAAPGR
jgi:hypothetical protein